MDYDKDMIYLYKKIEIYKTYIILYIIYKSHLLANKR